MTLQSPVTQTLYAQLQEEASVFNAIIFEQGVAGSAYLNHANGHAYWYWQVTEPDGKLRRLSLGRDTPDIRALVDRLKARKEEASEAIAALKSTTKAFVASGGMSMVFPDVCKTPAPPAPPIPIPYPNIGKASDTTSGTTSILSPLTNAVPIMAKSPSTSQEFTPAEPMMFRIVPVIRPAAMPITILVVSDMPSRFGRLSAISRFPPLGISCGPACCGKPAPTGTGRLSFRVKTGASLSPWVNCTGCGGHASSPETGFRSPRRPK